MGNDCMTKEIVNNQIIVNKEIPIENKHNEDNNIQEQYNDNDNSNSDWKPTQENKYNKIITTSPALTRSRNKLQKRNISFREQITGWHGEIKFNNSNNNN